MLTNLPEDCDVLCTHPMFGPESGKFGWQGLPFLYEKVRVKDLDRFFYVNIFHFFLLFFYFYDYVANGSIDLSFYLTSFAYTFHVDAIVSSLCGRLRDAK